MYLKYQKWKFSVMGKGVSVCTVIILNIYTIYKCYYSSLLLVVFMISTSVLCYSDEDEERHVAFLRTHLSCPLSVSGPPVGVESFSHLSFNLCRWCEVSSPVCRDSVCFSNCTMSSFCTAIEEICIAMWWGDTLTWGPTHSGWTHLNPLVGIIYY